MGNNEFVKNAVLLSTRIVNDYVIQKYRKKKTFDRLLYRLSFFLFLWCSPAIILLCTIPVG